VVLRKSRVAPAVLVPGALEGHVAAPAPLPAGSFLPPVEGRAGALAGDGFGAMVTVCCVCVCCVTVTGEYCRL
jgi:hypothetical protein